VVVIQKALITVLLIIVYLLGFGIMRLCFFVIELFRFKRHCPGSGSTWDFDMRDYQIMPDTAERES